MWPFITLKLNQLHALDQTYFLIVNSSQTQSYVISEASLQSPWMPVNATVNTLSPSGPCATLFSL